MSPTLHTSVPGGGLIGSHSPLRDSTSRPGSSAPNNSVMTLMSSCAPARTEGVGSGGIGG